MNRVEIALLYCFGALYLPSFAMYHLMVFRVNRWLPPDRRIPHTLSLIGWDRLATEYRRLYPRSSLYRMTLICAVVMLVVAVAFVIARISGYALSG